MNKALILAGCNIEPRKESIDKAISILKSQGISILGSSRYYESPPWGFESDKGFLNLAFIIATTLSARELLKILLNTEQQLGRNRTQSGVYEDRIMDLDILLYNEEVINGENINIPHPRMHLRRFALVPAAEIAGSWLHPGIGSTVKELLNECRDDSVVLALES